MREGASGPPLLPRAGLGSSLGVWVDSLGRRLIRLLGRIHALCAFLLISVGVVATKSKVARSVMRPLIRQQIARAGNRLLPMVVFLGFALGLGVIGQTVFLLNSVGAQGLMGTIMVTVVVRELGPVMAALLVLARVGTGNVIELGTARAMGAVEALEALGIDPIHYLVIPRMFGIALAVLSLTVYLLLVALGSGYLFAFLENVALLPGDYFGQLAGALLWQDFAVLGLKTLAFGVMIAAVTSFEGLAQPLRLEDVSPATTLAVAECVVGVVLVDAVFVIIYMLI